MPCASSLRPGNVVEHTLHLVNPRPTCRWSSGHTPLVLGAARTLHMLSGTKVESRYDRPVRTHKPATKYATRWSGHGYTRCGIGGGECTPGIVPRTPRDTRAHSCALGALVALGRDVPHPSALSTRPKRGFTTPSADRPGGNISGDPTSTMRGVATGPLKHAYPLSGLAAVATPTAVLARYELSVTKLRA